MKRKILKFTLILLAISMALFFLYFNNINLANPQTKQFYIDLKKELKQNGLSNNLLVISTKRIKWHNYIQMKFSGAAKDSKHLVGDAIDFIIFDINNDGISNHKDVDEVYKILDEKIIVNKVELVLIKMRKVLSINK